MRQMMRQCDILIIVVLIVFALVGILCIGANYTSRSIVQSPWHLLRTEGPEDSSTIDLTTAGNFAQKPAAAKLLPELARKVACITCAGEAADKTYTVTYMGWAMDNGPDQRICSVAYATGTQAVVKYPVGSTATNKYWADTAVVIEYRALPVEVCDGLGQNGVAEVTFYTEGLMYLYAEVTDANGSGAEANNVTIYWREKN